MSILYDGKVDPVKDKNHYMRDWSSNLDGHLMMATERYLGPGKQDYGGFKAYMREVFKRPFVMREHLDDWFNGLSRKVEGDASLREETLRDLQSELS